MVACFPKKVESAQLEARNDAPARLEATQQNFRVMELPARRVTTNPGAGRTNALQPLEAIVDRL
jgi:hypothetical protein